MDEFSQRPDWAPPDVDLDRPSPARMYDYMLGGSHHFAVDRVMAEQLIAVDPRIAASSLANRDFLRRVVEFLVDAGVKQFLDLGSGIPTVGNVHEVAHRIAPDARVAYVDIDPVAVAHSRAIIGNDPRVAVVHADITHPQAILTDRDVRRLIDFSQPVAVLLVAVLHFVPDQADPGRMIATLRDAVPPGSYLAISHADFPEELTERGEELLAEYRQSTSVALRDAAQVASFFGDFTLVEPGMSHIAYWRPDPDNPPAPIESFNRVHAAVARKP